VTRERTGYGQLMDLDVITEADESRTLLRATGSIDIASRERLGAAVRAALAADTTALVIDLSAVTFIDSTGIGTLVDAASQSADAGATFRIEAPSRPVARILEVSGLADHWGDDPTG
jgi:anti-sigma B factor antagonist